MKKKINIANTPCNEKLQSQKTWEEQFLQEDSRNRVVYMGAEDRVLVLRALYLLLSAEPAPNRDILDLINKLL